jgi:signal transduction histidine kinase/ActR/RegA family two-component response regulator
MAGCGIEAEVGASRRSYIEASGAAGWFAPTGDELALWADRVEAQARASDGASEFRLPDGRWVRHEAFRTQDGGGVTVLTDVTEQKASAVAMEAARDAAEAANRAKSEFLANMSHEIRTPLNGVLGIADVLMRTKLTARQRQLVGVVQQSGGLLNGLLTELLDLARVEAGMAELRPEPIRPGDLAAQVRDLFQGRAQEKGLALRLVVGPGAEAEVSCDPLRLRQILGNLLSNGIKFTEEGEVVLTLSRTADELRFAVRDTGTGFDAGLKERIFQRFSQADGSATRRQGGTGLGLAICDEYVRLMGGELECESTPGQGSLFAFALDLPARDTVAAPPPAERPPGRFRVLVVDDNAVNRQVLELVLESIGVDHASVENGLQSVEAMMTEGFDAVLMDIQMPIMDGLEATRRIRAWEAEVHRPRAPIVIVSANCMKEHVDAGRAAGADGHLNKPIAVADLLATLAPLMAAAERAERAAA